MRRRARAHQHRPSARGERDENAGNDATFSFGAIEVHGYLVDL